MNSEQCRIQSLPQTFLIRETFDLREQMLLKSTESCKFSYGLLVHRRKDSLVECRSFACTRSSSGRLSWPGL